MVGGKEGGRRASSERLLYGGREGGREGEREGRREEREVVVWWEGRREGGKEVGCCMVGRR